MSYNGTRDAMGIKWIHLVNTPIIEMETIFFVLFSTSVFQKRNLAESPHHHLFRIHWLLYRLLCSNAIFDFCILCYRIHLTFVYAC